MRPGGAVGDSPWPAGSPSGLAVHCICSTQVMFSPPCAQLT